MVKMIIDFNDGNHISGQFLVNSGAKCVNNQGSAYMNLELKDASGTVNAKKWEANAEDENIYKQGNVVYIEGEVLKYKESLQVKILSSNTFWQVFYMSVHQYMYFSKAFPATCLFHWFL